MLMKTQFNHTVLLLLAAILSTAFLPSCVHADACAEQIEPADQNTVPLPDLQAPECQSLEFANASSAREYMRHSADSALYAEGILPRMAGDALDYCTRLLNSSYDRFIVVDKARMKVVVFDRWGREISAYPMACALNYGTKHKRSDMRTPEGFFTVKGIFNSTDWLYTDDNGVTSPKKGQYGPRFIRLDTPVTSSIGIHGTSAPWSVGSRRSHGCIRLHNEDILKLVELTEKGMPVIVSPGKRDMTVNRSEGYDVEQISTVMPHSRS